MVKGVNNENVVRYLGTFHQGVNVYKNYIPVFDKKFVSPISDDALLFYKYKIKDTQVAYGHNIILVQYSPKRAAENCFTGDFWVGVLGSAYSYQKARFAVTGFNYIPPFGSLYYNVFAGKYFGTLPYPLLEIHPGNEYYYYNMYAFQMMNNYEFLSDEYVGFNTEHNFGGGIFNRIPGLKKLKFRQFWTAKGVVGTLSPANQALNLEKGYAFRTLKGSPYLELGT
eukprot:gene9909-9718_t